MHLKIYYNPNRAKVSSAATDRGGGAYSLHILPMYRFGKFLAQNFSIEVIGKAITGI